MRRLLLLTFAVAVLAAGVAFIRPTPHPVATQMVAVAEAFLGQLTAEQKQVAALPYDDASRFDWHYIPKDRRKGVQIKDLAPAQREAGFQLLQSGLSEIGYSKATAIMSLEEILRELEKEKRGGPLRDPERYFFCVFGQPSATGAWAWSLEGHHLSLNFSMADGKVVSVTPAFFGANPGILAADYAEGQDHGDGVRHSHAKGTRILAKEEEFAFALLHALGPEQRAVAVIAAKAPDDVAGAGQAQAKPQDPAGLAAAKMSAEQVKTLQNLVGVYVRNMPGELAEIRLAEIESRGWDKVHFAWAGADQPGIGHYYRVQGPTFLLELCNVQPDSAGNPANHIHSLWRSLTGDFGLRP